MWLRRIPHALIRPMASTHLASSTWNDEHRHALYRSPHAAPQKAAMWVAVVIGRKWGGGGGDGAVMAVVMGR